MTESFYGTWKHFPPKKKKAAAPKPDGEVRSNQASAAPIPRGPTLRNNGYVYVIGNSAGPVKVGRTTSPRTRLKALQTAAPVPIDVIACFDIGGQNYARVENAVHAFLRGQRKVGEWFDVPPSVAIDAIKHAGEIMHVSMSLVEIEPITPKAPKPDKGVRVSLHLPVDVLIKLQSKGDGWKELAADAIIASV